MLVGGTIGLILGVVVSFALFAASNHSPFTFIFVPIAVLMGIAQAVFSPKGKEDED